MAKNNITIVRGLIKYIDRIKEYSNNVDYDSFVSNIQLHEACIFNLLQMGELINRLDGELPVIIRKFP